MAWNGAQGDGQCADVAMSADGRYVAFESASSNLVPGDTNEAYDIFVYDRVQESIERVSITSSGYEGNGSSWEPAISADGRYVAFESWATFFEGDTGHDLDAFVYFLGMGHQRSEG